MIVASAQYPITRHAHFADWQQHTADWVSKAVRQGAQLLLFPEYGSMELVSLFADEVRTDIRRQVREMDALRADFCATYERLAREHRVVIVAPSFPVLEGNVLYNRVWVFAPGGPAGYQDKFFMTRFENEEWGISSAPKVLTVFEGSRGSFGIQICYDVEFPLGSALLAGAGATLLLAPSCTETIRGATRVHVGARARSLENQCYTVVSQTIGQSEWSPAVDINYGFSAIYASPDKNWPEEGIVARQSPQTPGWLVQSLDFSVLEDVRTDGHVFNFKDNQRLLSGFLDESITLRRVRLPE